MIKITIFILILIGIILVLTFILSYIIFSKSIKREKQERNRGPENIYRFRNNQEEVKEFYQWYDKMPKERLSIKSFDNYNLYAEYLKHDNPKGTIVMMHGYRSSFLVDFSLMIRELYNQGFNLLLVYERGCGVSEGKYITFGINERRDLLDWIKYLNNHYDKDLPIILYGVSLGAATVVMSTGYELDKNVKCIISDCGFSKPWDVCVHTIRRNFKMPPFPFLYITNLYGRMFAGYSLKQYSCEKALKTNKLPILYIHGKDDDVVPTAMGLKNYQDTTSKKDLLLVEGAKHVESFFIDTKHYVEKVLNFINENIYTKEL